MKRCNFFLQEDAPLNITELRLYVVASLYVVAPPSVGSRQAPPGHLLLMEKHSRCRASAQPQERTQLRVETYRELRRGHGFGLRQFFSYKSGFRVGMSLEL